MLYNRASCDPDGKPWDQDRRQIWWNESQQRWAGVDVPDFKVDSPPKDHMGPFLMNPEGVGRLFAPLAAFADGPFPEHYEPAESPVANPLHPNQSANPVAKRFTSALDKLGTAGEGYNIVCTTFRLTEHYHYWTKNNPMNVQLVPEPFVEIPAELADDLGLRGGERVRVTSARGHYVAKAMVTRRIKPMQIDGKKTYQIGIPIHWGYRGIAEDAGKTALNPATCSPGGHRPNAYAGVQGLPGESGEGIAGMSWNPPHQGHLGSRRPHPGEGAQRQEQVCKLITTTCIGCKACEVVPGMERPAFPRDAVREHLPDHAGDRVELLEPD